jgi:hypothetical protein
MKLESGRQQSRNQTITSLTGCVPIKPSVITFMAVSMAQTVCKGNDVTLRNAAINSDVPTPAPPVPSQQNHSPRFTFPKGTGSCSSVPDVEYNMVSTVENPSAAEVMRTRSC